MNSKLLTPEAIAQLNSLEVKARAIVDGLHLGEHRGRRIGFSSDFAEHRSYTAGDDVRHVDWKIFAKRDRYYVRRYEDEVQLQAWLIVDHSASMTYQSREAAFSKIAYANCLAASLAWVLGQQQDRVGLITLTHQVEEVISPRSDVVHLQQLFRHLQSLQEKVEQQPLGPAVDWHVLQSAIERIRDRSLVFLLSDLFGEPVELQRLFQLLRHKQCDVRVLQIIDSTEKSFPFSETTQFKNLEGGQAITVNALSVKEAYIAEFSRFLKQVRSLTIEAGIRYELVETNTAFNAVLRKIVE